MRNWVLPILLVLASPSLRGAPGPVVVVQAATDAQGHASPTTAAEPLQAAQDAGDAHSQVEPRKSGAASAGVDRTDTGVDSLRKALALARRDGKVHTEAAINRELVKALASAGRYQEALAASRAIESVNARIAEQERDRAVRALQAKFDDERKTAQTGQRSMEARLKDAEAATQRWRQSLGATLAAVALAAALLAVLRLRRVRRANWQRVANDASLTGQSSLDGLTGAFSRRHFAMLMQRHADADSAEVGLVMLDLDHFKRVNDALGQAAGDAVLVEVARRLQTFARNHDHVVRWGGGEFVLVLHAISPHDLPLAARRLLDSITQWPIHVDRHQVSVSISAGGVVHPLQPGDRWEPALRLADAAMYLAKRHGRNRAACVTTVHAPTDRDLANGDVAAAILAGAIEVTEVAGPPDATTRIKD